MPDSLLRIEKHMNDVNPYQVHQTKIKAFLK